MWAGGKRELAADPITTNRQDLFIMTNNDSTNNHETRKLTAREVSALADRLLSRALSMLFDAQPHLKADMLLASACLRVLASAYPNGVEVDVWRG
jgi:hypothetical protein